MNEFHEVVLTGLGAITARGDSTLHDFKARHFEPSENSVFQIADFDLKTYLSSPKTYLDRCSALALAGCALALQNAGISSPLNSDDSDLSTQELCGITLGTHLGCLETMKTFWDKATEKGARLANPLLFSHSYLNSPISLCAIEFGLKGYHATFCSNQNSGLDAVRAAYDALRLGHVGLVVCGGVEAITPARELFEPQQKMGEASVFFVLETCEHAALRKAKSQIEFSDDWFDVGKDMSTQVIETFGRCGGATSALQLFQSLNFSQD